jgi:hypothetical protein
MDGSTQIEQELPPELAARREAALASLRQKAVKREAGGYAVMAGVMSLGPATQGGGRLGKTVHYARLFLIAFAMLAPNYLIWRLLL